MEAWKWQELLWTAGFLSITYIPLQCVAIWKCRGLARIAAGLPLLVMVPMALGSFQPLDYDLGSPLAMFFVCPYLPAMIYLIAVSLFGSCVPNICPHCGHKRRIISFQMTASSANCENCGKDMIESASAEPGATPDHGRV